MLISLESLLLPQTSRRQAAQRRGYLPCPPPLQRHVGYVARRANLRARTPSWPSSTSGFVNDHLAPIKLQLELQDWTPREPISPADLDAAVEGYREWVLAMLEDPDEELL